MTQPLNVMAEGCETKTECHAISIAIDVSGSMKKTDSQKHSIELIKLFMDLCNETDYLSVTAYNDQIVYHSGLVSMGNTAQKDAVKDDLDKLQFMGETDNGLGLITATNAIVESELEYDNAFIILVTDGNTDLENSTTDRTTEDSTADMQTSAEMAKERDITIDVVEYTNAYNQDTGLLSVISASTGGGATIVDNAPQFIQVMLGLFFSEYGQGKANLKISESEEYLNRNQSSVELLDNQKGYDVIFTTEKMTDCEVTNDTDSVVVHRGSHYLVQEIKQPGIHELKSLYSVEQPTTIVSGNVVFSFEEEPAKEIIEIIEVEDKGSAPKGQDITKQIYADNENLVMDTSSIFEDADHDIVKYNVVKKEGTAEFSISGSMLSIKTDKSGFNQYEITAVDSKQNEKTICLNLEIIPAWKQYQPLIIVIIICLILLCAIGISIYIVKRLLFANKKPQRAINGYLKACFIDLKSKNESADIEWNLSEYPPEGVTLEELLLSKKIKENFKDIDKVCFYPGKHFNEMILVHCMEGGVFLGEQIIKANTPVTICSGDVLYISFAENASEIEFRYMSAN